MHDFKKLEVWQDAIELVTAIYQLTPNFPPEERYGLTSQITRSAVSIASNIAEGAGRNTNGEFVNFLGVANGSAYELETQLIIANNLGYLTVNQLDSLKEKMERIQKKIYKLKQSLTRR